MLRRLTGRIRTERAAGANTEPTDEPLVDNDPATAVASSAQDHASDTRQVADGECPGDTSADTRTETHGATLDYESAASADDAVAHTTRTITGLRCAIIASILVVAVLGGLIGYLGYRTYETRLAAQQRELFLQTARQAAVNLTTISYAHADQDVARILDSATGSFQDTFRDRAQSFIDVVKKAQSESEGTVTAAGLESVDADRAQVIVALSVKTSNAGVPEQQPRGWRMRLSVQKMGDTAKVSDVQFVA
jgi:Mce-associated membrane protein